MRKVVIRRPGGYERLEIEEAPDLTPGPGEVLVAVAATGVNYADCIIRMGLYSSAKVYVGWPITPGFEFAGTVAAVGAGVTAWSIGQAVFGVTRFSGYASQVVVPQHQLFARPDALPAAQAAGLPAIFLTADYAAHELAAAPAGSWALVHSAAGGVGSALVQILRARGCRVIGVVGASHKVASVRELGAEVVIDKSREDLWGAVRRVAPDGLAAVFDANGPPTLRAGYRHLRPSGRMVVYGFHGMLPRGRGTPNWLALAWNWLMTPSFSSLALVDENKGVLGFNLSYMFHRTDVLEGSMRRILAGFADGSLRMPAVVTYPMTEVWRAQRDLETGSTIGKLVLLPGA
ncbi:MAG: zinc-binding dehydrogenase [Myxococcales bacterium]|nr:zinc-binding dehydrogenase [Myxococcales bacterium]